MYVSFGLAEYVSAFIQWGFLMAFLYCLVTSISEKNKSTLYLASIMLCSYLLSDYVYIMSNVYLDWILYDLLTILLIIVCLKTSIIKNSLSARFIIIGLTINSLLVSLIYYDLYVLNNLDEWWFWSFFSISINTIDLLMISSLVINLDSKKISRHIKLLMQQVKDDAPNG